MKKSDNKPFLSVIIPTYNRAELLPRCLESVVSENLEEVEVIIIDDGSTDNSQEVVDPYLKKYPSIQYFKSSENQGFFEARNKGVRKSRGEWVSFLDSDDEYLPGALPTILSSIKETNKKADALMFQLEAIDAKGQKLKLGYKPNNLEWKKYQPQYAEVVLKKGVVRDQHRVVRRSILLNYPLPKDDPGYETGYYAFLAKQDVKFLYINLPVAKVHTGAANQTSQISNQNKHRQWVKAKTNFLVEHRQVLTSHHRYVKELQILAHHLYRAQNVSLLMPTLKALISSKPWT